LPAFADNRLGMHDDRATAIVVDPGKPGARCRCLELAAILVTHRDADHGSVAQAPGRSLAMADTAAHTSRHIAFARGTGGRRAIATGGDTLVWAGSGTAERPALRAWKNDFR
jgi:glyoxylase-like metal-dependent hydrolase (beta-lactamase superfamily II)